VTLVDGLGGEEESLGRHFLLGGVTLPLQMQRGRAELRLNGPHIGRSK
jgi:hypothetical protein